MAALDPEVVEQALQHLGGGLAAAKLVGLQTLDGHAGAAGELGPAQALGGPPTLQFLVPDLGHFHFPTGFGTGYKLYTIRTSAVPADGGISSRHGRRQTPAWRPHRAERHIELSAHPL